MMLEVCWDGPWDTFLLGPHNSMVTALGSCLKKWPRVRSGPWIKEVDRDTTTSMHKCEANYSHPRKSRFYQIASVYVCNFASRVLLLKQTVLRHFWNHRKHQKCNQICDMTSHFPLGQSASSTSSRFLGSGWSCARIKELRVVNMIESPIEDASMFIGYESKRLFAMLRRPTIANIWFR